MQLTTTHRLHSEKKHSVRYDEDTSEVGDGNHILGAIYIHKTALGKKPYPQAIRIKIEVIE